MLDTVENSFYDEFAGPDLDEGRWMYLEYPIAGQEPLRCAEPGAVVSVGEGRIEVRVDSFTNSHDSVQMMDNPKHLLLSTKSFSLPEQGSARFSVEMSAENIGGNPDDFRDGIAAFNVLDLGSGMVFDASASSKRIWSIYERLPVPGVDEPFTYMVEAPFAGIDLEPGRFHRYEVEFDTTAWRVSWYVDGCLAFRTGDLPAKPQQLTLGLGLFTLHPIAEGASRSLRGQGMKATWRNLSVQRAEV